jgi:thiol-disulfide isomerase/thioredoxin
VSQVRLFLIHAPGCHVCEGARIALRRFAKANPLVKVFEIDITRFHWPENAQFQPTVTPTYVVHDPEAKKVAVHEGQMAAGKTERPYALQTWVNKKLPPGPARNRVLEAQWRMGPHLLPARSNQ